MAYTFMKAGKEERLVIHYVKKIILEIRLTS